MGNDKEATIKNTTSYGRHERCSGCGRLLRRYTADGELLECVSYAPPCRACVEDPPEVSHPRSWALAGGDDAVAAAPAPARFAGLIAALQEKK